MTTGRGRRRLWARTTHCSAKCWPWPCARKPKGAPTSKPPSCPTTPWAASAPCSTTASWIAALRRENVDLVTDPIAEITPEGVRTKDGALHAADVIIYGTGFQASKFLMPMAFKGRGGADLHDTWAGDSRAYYGMTTPGFPNLFILYGPNTNIVVNASIIFFSECSVRYILGCLKLMTETGAPSLEVKKSVHDAFNKRVDAENLRMAWGAPQSKSWYKNETGRVSQNWPFALVDYWKGTLEPDPGDFIFTPAKQTANALA